MRYLQNRCGLILLACVLEGALRRPRSLIPMQRALCAFLPLPSSAHSLAHALPSSPGVDPPLGLSFSPFLKPALPCPPSLQGPRAFPESSQPSQAVLIPGTAGLILVCVELCSLPHKKRHPKVLTPVPVNVILFGSGILCKCHQVKMSGLEGALMQ